MKTVVAEQQELITQAAAIITKLVSEKPEAVLAFSGGRTMEPLFAELARLCDLGKLSLAKAKLFPVTEYIDAPESMSCRTFILSRLIARTDADKTKLYTLNEAGAEGYDELIEANGGIDLAVLGLGDNAHIGYNEPATPFESYTHVQKLTPATLRQLSPVFGGADRVPAYAVTMGIKTIISAKKVLLMAFGPEKAEAVFNMVYGKTITYIPASFLQIPTDVTVFLDTQAAEKL